MVVVLVAVVAAAAVAAAVWSGSRPASDRPPGAAPTTATPTTSPTPIAPAGRPVGPCTEPVAAPIPLERRSGGTPAGSAACAALTAFPDGAGRAVVATGTAEALVAAPLAIRLEGPVLLAERDALPGETVTALRDLGVDEVTLVGTASERLVTALGHVVGDVDQLDAADLTGLSLEVAAAAASRERLYVSPSDPSTLLVAAAAAARDATAVVVLDAPPEAAARELLARAETIRAVGHPSVLGEEVVAPLRPLAAVERIDGTGPAGTAAGIARVQPADGPVHLVTTSDAGIADAVAVAWSAPVDGGPVLLTDADRLAAETARWLRLRGLDDVRPVRLLGAPPTDAAVARLSELAVAATQGPPPPQVRGAWAHLFDDSLKTRAGITAFLDRAVETGLNTVFVQVARRQDAYYASEVLPRTTDPALTADLDVLAELVPRAHARGLDVHAWFAVVQSWHRVYEELPAPGGWVWTAHGPGSDDPWLTRPHPDRADDLGYPDAYRDYPYLDLGVPAVQDHIVATLVEVAVRYEVDALHLDYLRYPGAEWGYHPTALRRFADQTGASIDPVPAVDDPRWSAWRRQQATDLLARIRAEVHAVRPDVELSAALIAQGEGPTDSRPFAATIAYADKMQDWVGWVRAGLVDLAVPMAYFDQRRYAERYGQWTRLARQLVEAGNRVAIGQGSWLNPSALSLAQAEAALRETGGLVLYSYQQDTWCPAGTTETGDPCSPVEPPATLWHRLAAGPFAEPAPPR